MNNSEILDKIRAARVGIAGAGGLGSNVAMALARAGVGSLLIVDFDKVEASNLNRQQFFLDQVGALKVVALKTNILQAVSGCNVDALNKKLEQGKMHEEFSECDIIIEALDNAETKARFIEECLAKLDAPVVAASGVAGIDGAERVRVRRYGKLYLVEEPDAKPAEEDVLLAPKVGLMAHYQACIVLELLASK